MGGYLSVAHILEKISSSTDLRKFENQKDVT